MAVAGSSATGGGRTPPRVVTVVGARPQFIKAAAVSPLLRARFEEILIHTGQHYDPVLSDDQFADGGLPRPDLNLQIGSFSHAVQTARMMVALEEAFLRYAPALVLVYGDTNSTLAAALVAAKLELPIAHVEAGLRSHDMTMPEEVNRVVTDRLARLLFCPTPTAVAALAAEGITAGVVHAGDVMYDTLLAWQRRDGAAAALPEGLQKRRYLLLTLHRPRNVDDEARLRQIIEAVRESGEPVLFPVHPRTRDRLDAFGLSATLAADPTIRLVAPPPRSTLLHWAAQARVVLTDSGGLQKEAFMLGRPCATLRDSSEWTETLVGGWNVLVDADPVKIAGALVERSLGPRPALEAFYGDGRAAAQIVDAIETFLTPGAGKGR